MRPLVLSLSLALLCLTACGIRPTELKPPADGGRDELSRQYPAPRPM